MDLSRWDSAGCGKNRRMRVWRDLGKGGSNQDQCMHGGSFGVEGCGAGLRENTVVGQPCCLSG